MYVKLMKRREIGRYGDGVSGATGSHACSGLTSMKSAPVLLCESTMRVLRSSKSPTPQDPADRMEYSWAIQPHSWSCSMAGSIGIRSGALISVASCVRSPTLTCSVWYPIGRSAGMVMDAVATNLPSTSYACDPSPAPGSSAPWYSSPFSSVMVAGDETPVALAKDTDNGIIDGVIVMGVHAQRTQQRLQDIIIDLVIVVAHADVARGQSNQTRQMDQRTRETLRTFCTLCPIP